MPLEAFHIIGILVLAAAMACGIIRYRNRNRARDRIREQAIRRSGDDPESFTDCEKGS